MAVTRVAILLAVAGCDYVLGLERNIDASSPFMPPLDGPEPDAPMGCWTNARQNHDEDKDRVMDGCDNCPATFNEQQEDDDMDGVGNACDPKTGPGHRHQIAMFRSFYEETDLGGLAPDNDALWQIGNDSLFQNTRRNALLTAITPFREATIDTRFRMYSNGDIGMAEVGLYASSNDTTETSLHCNLRMTAGAPSVHLVRAGANADETLDDTVTVGQSVGMRFRVTHPATSSPRCEFDTDDDAELSLDNFGPAAGYTALYTGNSTAEFFYLLVITPRFE